jgi:hypothetical protein
LDTDLSTVDEQDHYPVEPHIPLPIGARTAGYRKEAAASAPCGARRTDPRCEHPAAGSAGCADQKEALDGE